LLHLTNGEYQSLSWYNQKNGKKVMDLGIDVPDDILNANGYHKINSKNKVVEKAALSIKESEWFEYNKNLPFTGEEDNNFLELAGNFWLVKILNMKQQWKDYARHISMKIGENPPTLVGNISRNN